MWWSESGVSCGWYGDTVDTDHSWRPGQWQCVAMVGVDQLCQADTCHSITPADLQQTHSNKVIVRNYYILRSINFNFNNMKMSLLVN